MGAGTKDDSGLLGARNRVLNKSFHAVDLGKQCLCAGGQIILLVYQPETAIHLAYLVAIIPLRKKVILTSPSCGIRQMRLFMTLAFDQKPPRLPESQR